MRDEDKNYRTMKQIIKDSTDRELERYETKGLTPDELKTMVAAAKRKKKQRYRKLAGVAALFVVVLFGAIIVFNNFSTDVEADKNAKEVIVTEDGVIIEDGGWGSSSEDNWIITDWAEVKVAKATIPELIVPEYIPDGYEFEQLSIVGCGTVLNVEYLFTGNNINDLAVNQYIHNENLEATFIENNDRCINSDKGDVYIINGEDNKKAIMQLDDGIVAEIRCGISDKEIIKIINHMSF